MCVPVVYKLYIILLVIIIILLYRNIIHISSIYYIYYIIYSSPDVDRYICMHAPRIYIYIYMLTSGNLTAADSPVLRSDGSPGIDS